MKTSIFKAWLLTLALAGSPGLAAAADPSPPSVASKPPAQTLQPARSIWYDELTKLAQAGVTEQVMIAFVDSAGTFNLDADKILALRDYGVTDQVFNSVLQHDSELAQGLRIESPSTAPATTHLTFVKMTPEKPAVEAKPAAATADDSIIGTPASYEDDDLLASWTEDAEGAPARSSVTTRVSPVREPYPVQLTQTIVMLPLALKTPNVHVLVPFP